MINTEKKTIEINDILVSRFGYNCTLVNFYKVLSKTSSGKSVKIIRLKNKIINDDGYGQAGEVVASSENDGNNVLTKRILKTKNNDECLSIDSYEYAYLWDGKPVYFDSYD